MRVVSIVGARPQFVKLAAIAAEFAKTDHEHVIVHTGQHYESTMSDVFFTDLQIPEPQYELHVGSDTHARQTAAMLSGLDDTLSAVEADWVLTYGDTNTTLAAALCAAKRRISVAHLEAGLRSFNRQMPEEHNRVLTDHCCDLLLAPTQTAINHLSEEGLSARAVFVGDVMADVLYRVRDSIREGRVGTSVDSVRDPYLVATIHRPSNTDSPMRLDLILRSLSQMPVPVLLPIHPRLADRAAAFGLSFDYGAIRPMEPQPYPKLIRLMLDSGGVITDSGGLQKEAYLLEKPCTTVRHETEWPETLLDGWNILLPDCEALPEVALRKAPACAPRPVFGDGHAAERVVRALTGPERAASATTSGDAKPARS